MENQNTSPYNSAGLFLITIGLLLINTVIFSFIGRYLGQVLWDVDVTQLVKGDIEYGRPHSNALRLTQFLAQAGGFIFSVYVVLQLLKRRVINFTKLNESPNWKWFGLSFILFFTLIPGVEWLVEWNKNLNFPEAIVEQFKSYQDNNMKIYGILLHYNTGFDLVINLFVMALLPAVAEELFFRGLLMRIFRKMFGNMHAAVWLTAVVFAGFHMQPYNIVPMMLMAGIFGYVYYFTGSLWVPIILHFVNNAAYIILHNQNVGNDAMTTGSTETLIISAIGLILFVFMLKRSPKPKLLSLE